jgi:hypothetical protein
MEDAGRIDDGGGLVHLEVRSEEGDVDLAGPPERLDARAELIDGLLRNPRSPPRPVQQREQLVVVALGGGLVVRGSVGHRVAMRGAAVDL